jgi:negative regulator of flagellin synthesis FlgM
LKIDSTINSLNNAQAKPSAPSVRESGTRASTPVATEDVTVDLSPMTAEAHRLQAKLMQPDSRDFDAARVAAIRRAISEGRYQVNAGKIADGLIDSVRQLLKK